MNKKYLLIALSCLTIIGKPINMFAEGYDENYIEKTTTGNQNVELYADYGNNYVVRLPKKVDISAEETTFKVEVKGSIAADKEVCLTLPSSTTFFEQLTGEGTARTLSLAVAKDKTSFDIDDLDEDDYTTDATCTITITHDPIKSGVWKNQFPVTIGLFNKK